MKKITLLLISIVLFSCGSRKIQLNKTEIEIKEVVTDNSIIETKTDSNLKVTTSTETNIETGEVTEIETLEPIDVTKPAIYIDEAGKSQSLNNAKKTKTKTTQKSNENKKSNIVVDKIEKVAKKQQTNTKKENKTNTSIKDKVTESEKGNFWYWVLLILTTIGIIYFFFWSRKLVNDKEKLDL